MGKNKQRHIILKDWETKSGFRAVVIRTDMGHLCGYVAVDRKHQLFGKSYSQHCDCLIPSRDKAMKGKIGKRGIIPVFCYDGEKASMDIVFNVHGGITYAQTNKEYPAKSKFKLHWIGFDCAHLDDTPDKCDLDYCEKECEDLAKQIKLNITKE